mmetsp:Transcript_34524/g.37262  ORF Transcript_34524/g.37262 Transcript_34524/m.37262 type:complete len:147 (+) Transcript_34524:146-586(+)
MTSIETATSDRILIASKRAVYVGGIGEEVSPQILRSAMIPFGNIKSLDIPMDYKVGKTRGFAFVEYEESDDANECIFNMDGSDLMGRTIKVSLAQQNQLSKLSSQSAKGQAIWNSDEWFQQHVLGNDEDAKQKLNDAQEDKETLKD